MDPNASAWKDLASVTEEGSDHLFRSQPPTTSRPGGFADGNPAPLEEPLTDPRGSLPHAQHRGPEDQGIPLH